MSHSSKIVLDLDGVIAGPKKDNYLDCEPNWLVVKRIKELKPLGFVIAIHTSRNVRTHQNSFGKLVADTAAVIAEWLKMHGIPYDEIWVGKPWVGKSGVYVDDRAITPHQFTNLTMGELMNIVKGNAVGYDEPSKQAWVIQPFDAELVPRQLVDGSFQKTITKIRELGYRTCILLDASVNLPFAMREELRRLGAKVMSLSRHTSVMDNAKAVIYSLLDTGEIGPESPVCLVSETYVLEDIEDSEGYTDGDARFALASAYLNNEDIYDSTNVKTVDESPSDPKAFRILKSRHFNYVTVAGDRVFKTSDDEQMRKKLKLEMQWLLTFPHISATGVEDAPGGYSTRLSYRGPLSTYLLRKGAPEHTLISVATKIRDLCKELSLVQSATEDELREMTLAHSALIVDKSWDRIKKFDSLLKEASLPQLTSPWIVNGVHFNKPADLVADLIEAVSLPVADNFSIVHGDLCPGNILIAPITGPLSFRLIDPRATSDGETLQLHGDGRYDLAKLCHALDLGYDTILENWYDCEWSTETTNSVQVSLSLWDELPGAPTPARTTVWKSLSERKIRCGPTALESPEIKALAALQLITCAPLHMDDPKRAIALFSRGLLAGVQALSAMKRD